MANFITPFQDQNPKPITNNPVTNPTPIPPQNAGKAEPPTKVPNHNARRLILLGIVILIITIGFFGYFVIAKGTTMVGEKIEDQIWRSLIDNSTKDLSEKKMTIQYVDKGTFKFLPSDFLKSMPAILDSIDEEEIKELDKRYAFTISDFTAVIDSNVYTDISNIEKPQADINVESVVNNNSKDFEGSLDFRLKESEAFFRYNYNTNVGDLIDYTFGGRHIPNPSINRWNKTTDEFNLQGLRDAIKYYTLVKTPMDNQADAKRLADVRQIASALELYYNDNGHYPDSKENKPIDLEPTYLQSYPIAPFPPDGTCSEDLNNYYYEVKQNPTTGNNTDYSLTFCLGSKTAGLEAGNQEMTPAGLQSYSNCPADRQCIGSKQDQEKSNPYKELLKENRLFDIQSLRGMSIINGQPTLHYSLVLNKEKLRNLFEGSLDLTFKSEYDGELKNFFLEIGNAVIDKVEVQTYEVWIGTLDRKVYKSQLTMNALSAAGAANHFSENINDPNNPVNKALKNDLDSSKSKARDAKRIADIRQLASALELYFNDNNSYPPSENGKPTGISPMYINDVPNAPTPFDGNCTAEQNKYWYTQLSPSSYNYTFCIGGDAGGMGAGVVTMSERGMESQFGPSSTEPCPDDFYCEEHSGSTDLYFESFKSTLINMVKDISFDAQITVEFNAKNYGKVKNIESPPDATDL